MTKRERVKRAIAHREADKVPKGELHIEPLLIQKMMPGDYSLDYQDFHRDLAIRELLGIDLINLGDWPAQEIGRDRQGNIIYRSVYGEEYVHNGKSKHVLKPGLEDIENVAAYPVPDIGKVSGELIRRFATETDLFVFAQIGGPVSMINEMLGMEDFLVYSMTHTAEICRLAEKIMTYEIAKAKLFIDNGAAALIIADDIAYNSGAFLPPRIMAETTYPFYRQAIQEIKRHQNVPVFMHTDGDIRQMLADIAACGFDGLHSLQPSAGMDIAQVKREYGDRLCLMGNIDLDYIMTFATPREVSDTVKRTIDAAADGGGYILSTCNTLIDAIPVDNALAMYETAEAHGVYR